MTDDMMSVIETAAQPLYILKDTVVNTVSAAEKTYESAKTAYSVAKISSPETAQKLKTTLNRSFIYYSKMKSLEGNITSLCEQVDTYINEYQSIANDTVHHSNEYISKKMNECVSKVGRIVQKGKYYINEKINNIEDNVKKNAEKTLQKEKEKLQESANKLIENQLSKQKNISKQKQNTQSILLSAPKL